MTRTEASVSRTQNLLIAVVAAVAVLGGACTISQEIPDLEFGSGEVPFTVPAGFPLPDVAVIGTTMIDGVNGRTEMIVNFPANVSEVAAFYVANLPILGFEITDSKGTDAEWDISLTKDGVTGTIHLTFAGTGLSSGMFTFDHS